jgi:hypothetical protein
MDSGCTTLALSYERQLSSLAATCTSTHLGVGVGNPELHALNVAVDHVVHSVRAAASYAKDLRSHEQQAARRPRTLEFLPLIISAASVHSACSRPRLVCNVHLNGCFVAEGS